jgi:hypothetical protein
MTDDLEVDLSAYLTAPAVKAEGECEWCDETANDEQGPVRHYGGEIGDMHAGCAYSYEHDALATQLKKTGLRGTDDLDPAEVAELEQRMIDNDGEGITPWWENR